jgi:hypothetical protein
VSIEREVEGVLSASQGEISICWRTPDRLLERLPLEAPAQGVSALADGLGDPSLDHQAVYILRLCSSAKAIHQFVA